MFPHLSYTSWRLLNGDTRISRTTHIPKEIPRYFENPPKKNVSTSRGHQGWSRGHQDRSRDHQDWSRGHQDWSRGHQDRSRAEAIKTGAEATKTGAEQRPPRQEQRPPRQEQRPPRQEQRPPRQKQRPPRQEQRPGQDRSRGHQDRSRGHQDRSRGHQDRSRGHQDKGRAEATKTGAEATKTGPEVIKTGAEATKTVTAHQQCRLLHRCPVRPADPQDGKTKEEENERSAIHPYLHSQSPHSWLILHTFTQQCAVFMHVKSYGAAWTTSGARQPFCGEPEFPYDWPTRSVLTLSTQLDQEPAAWLNRLIPPYYHISLRYRRKLKYQRFCAVWFI